jgi:uncharacterized repeat protein (TIGR01451 family)
MKRHSLVSVALTICYLLLCASLALAQVTLFDGDFNPSNWDDDRYIQEPGTSIPSITTNPSGGNPGANREMTVRFDENTGGNTSYIWLFSRYTATSYNPSVQGAISSINYSEDARVAASSAHVDINIPSRIGLLQNDTIYRSRNVSTIHSQPFPSSWQSINLDGLVAANFVKHNTGPGPDRPDFSETGSEIFFGYIRGNQHYSTDYEFVICIDNWSVTINQQGDATYTINKIVLNDAGDEITSAKVGDTITYRITFTNIGDEDLSGIEIIDTLPDNLQYDSYSATQHSGTVTHADGPPAATVTWPVGPVAGGNSARLDIHMIILDEADQQVLTNQAEVTAIDAPAAAGQSAAADLDVHPQEADLEFVLLSTEDLGDVGGGVYKTRVTNTVRNNGPDDAESVVIVYKYPQKLNSPEVVLTGDPINDLMDCEDRPADREFYCELPPPNRFRAGVTAELVIDYVRTGNSSSPEVTMTATTDDPILSNNNYTTPPVDTSVSNTPKKCFIQHLLVE